jgi:dihydrofolate reductase
VAEEVSKLKQEPGQDILMTGSGTLVHSLLSAGLIDELKLLVHPIIVGRGKRFFTHQMDMSKLDLIKTQTLSLGVVLLCYQPARRQVRDLP